MCEEDEVLRGQPGGEKTERPLGRKGLHGVILCGGETHMARQAGEHLFPNSFLVAFQRL